MCRIWLSEGISKHQKLKKKSKTLDINLQLVEESILMAKQNYIRNHTVRHDRWPPCRTDNPSANKAIIWSRLYNKDPHSKLVEMFGSLTVTFR
jgi:hypothetical protein